MLIGFVIGIYDGALGPGTGSFLVLTLVGLMGYSFLEASAKAKIANLATNLGALTVFAPGGHIVWRVAVVMAVANVAGGYVGARTAVSRGSSPRWGLSSTSGAQTLKGMAKRLRRDLRYFEPDARTTEFVVKTTS